MGYFSYYLCNVDRKQELFNYLKSNGYFAIEDTSMEPDADVSYDIQKDDVKLGMLWVYGEEVHLAMIEKYKFDKVNIDLYGLICEFLRTDALTSYYLCDKCGELALAYRIHPCEYCSELFCPKCLNKANMCKSCSDKLNGW